MNLREYLFQNNIKHNAFAKSLKISYRTLWGIIYGSDMKLSLALKIEKLTKGEVKCKDLDPINSEKAIKKKSQKGNRQSDE